MKYTILFLLLLGRPTVEVDGLDQLKWLVGTWERMDMKPGNHGFEVWELEDSELNGMGVSMKGTDTTFVEKLRIQEVDGVLYYVADVPGNSEPTSFRVTELGDGYFKCENPQHDFPKEIGYELLGDTLKATISADGRGMTFLFKKIK